MNDPTPSDEPKIIVDDDWKEQVQREKESAESASHQQSQDEQEIPPASIAMLVTTLSTQALASMGYIPDPSGQNLTNLPLAKHFIDTLAVLDEKTKGNLTDEEAALLTETLHQLRMAFVNAPTTGQPEQDQPDSDTKSSIELP